MSAPTHEQDRLRVENERLQWERDTAKRAHEDMLARWGSLVYRLQALRELAEWLTSLDQPWMRAERAQVTLSQITERASIALREADAE